MKEFEQIFSDSGLDLTEETLPSIVRGKDTPYKVLKVKHVGNQVVPLTVWDRFKLLLCNLGLARSKPAHLLDLYQSDEEQKRHELHIRAIGNSWATELNKHQVPELHPTIDLERLKALMEEYRSPLTVEKIPQDLYDLSPDFWKSIPETRPDLEDCQPPQF